MSFTELSDGFFMKSAGWEAVKNARALLAGGKVISSNWTPPLLKGVVQEGASSYRAGLVINGPVDIDNLCTCRASREAGIICAHSVAVGLHHLLNTKSPPRAATRPHHCPRELVAGSSLESRRRNRDQNSSAPPMANVWKSPSSCHQPSRRESNAGK